MSSNIRIQRICEYCNNEFTARTTLTKYCSHKCNSRHYKAKAKETKIDISNMETKGKVNIALEKIKKKEFLNVEEVALLLNCSKRTVYSHIRNGSIHAVNLGHRLTRIKKSTLDGLFE
ncbi:helix-turn-helix domain-containing protein [Aureibaculum algae]|uniref:Helix-turn-helix domain-containing protein n=2 Tax=Aureibaculum algae TaxID=2584122 RepID=A0A5B7TT15_9FLAO|nr:helix-turn-helix domain-containing protein [Aureibaculum algae]